MHLNTRDFTVDIIDCKNFLIFLQSRKFKPCVENSRKIQKRMIALCGIGSGAFNKIKWQPRLMWSSNQLLSRESLKRWVQYHWKSIFDRSTMKLHNSIKSCMTILICINSRYIDWFQIWKDLRLTLCTNVRCTIKQTKIILDL